MRKILLLLTVVCFAIIACKSKKENFVSKYLNANNLPQQSFVIYTQKDTVIKTQQGIVVKIDAGSIEAATPTVTLQIKEALSLEDILQAGLTTQTSKGILSSEGMFNISTKEESSIKKPLQIELPTDAVDENMQLYKGVEEEEKIVWQETKKLEPKPTDAPDGKALFIKNCASCHAIDKKLTGPALAWVENRWQQRKNLIEYIKNNQKFMQIAQDTTPQSTVDEPGIEYDRVMGITPTEGAALEDDGSIKNDSTTSTKKNIKKIKFNSFDKDVLYARRVYCDYGKSAMNVFEGVLTNKEVNAILKYIKRESKLLPTPVASNSSTVNVDSCEIYANYYQALLNKRDSFDNLSNNMVEKEIIQSTTIAPKAVFPTPKNTTNNSNPFGGSSQTTSANNVRTNTPIIQKVNPNSFESDKYQFKIEAYGWYNIDRLLSEEFNSKKSELTVTIQSKETQKIQLYLVIPSLKIFTEGGILKDEKSYGFYDEDGSVYLPQNVDAFVYAIGEEGGKIFYGSQQFSTSLKQNIDLKIVEINKEDVIKKIQAFKLKEFSMNIIETNKLENIKSIDKEIERVGIKIRDCDCGNWSNGNGTTNQYSISNEIHIVK